MRLSGGQQLLLSRLLSTGVTLPPTEKAGEICVSFDIYCDVAPATLEAASRGDDLQPDDYRKIDAALVELERRRE